MKIKPNPDELKDAFDSFDIGGNGYVLVSDLKRAVTELGEKFSEKEMAEFLDSAGLTPEDTVTYQGENTKLILHSVLGSKTYVIA